MDEIVVFYFFQGEPGESFDLPNAFIMKIDKRKSRAVTVNDLIQSFPTNALPSSSNPLHFRFKIEDDECGYVWLDIKNNTNEKIPLYSGCIIAKIIIMDASNSSVAIQKKKKMLKLKSSSSSSIQSKFTNYLNNNNSASSRSSQNRVDSTAKNTTNTNTRSTTSSPGQRQQQQPSSQQRQPPTGNVNPRASSSSSVLEADLISTTATAASAAPTSSGTSATGRRTVDNTIFPSSNTSNASLSTTASVEADMDMFHFDNNNDTSPSAQSKPQSQSVQNHNNNDDNLMAFDSPPAAATRTTNSAISAATGVQLSRAELKEIREQGIEDKVKKALENKQEVDDVGRKESEEFDTAREKHDEALTAWSTNNKEKRNIRSLLSTMHTVLWSGCTTWKPIGLGDVIDSKQVKLQYRKAMLVVHPDRCSGPNISGEVKFIAKRVFEAINEAYQEFLKKETV